MEKPASPRSLPDSTRELQCVGKLKIVGPKPSGFLCGSIPVPTDKTFLPAFNSALVPSGHESGGPRFKELPPSTDLNSLPAVANLPLSATQFNGPGVLPLAEEGVSLNLKRKCEVLAVSGLVDYGDEIDVIAPTDILKQIFKMPYSRSGLSIAVHRVGQTLILNGGPDIEGEKFVRRHTNQKKAAENSLFLNFAMHSVRMEACDCPPGHKNSSHEQLDPHMFMKKASSKVVGQSQNTVRENNSKNSSYATFNQDSLWVKCNSTERSKDKNSVAKSSHGIEQPRKSMQESDKHNDGFSRVFMWQFHNFRMLLGSDMLIFSNDKYVAVSLHLWDITNEVSPLTWLEAWLDNVMANVPELAICYHKNGVVHRYELLKTEEILREAVSDDGFPVFNPYIVQQNGLSVLRFLQENCKQDPGAYWLHKNAGEEVIQLFDFSTLPNSCPKDNDANNCSLPSLFCKGRSDSLLSLGTLLYRIANRLSNSMIRDDQIKCATFFRKCLELLNEPDYLVIRAFAHEQFARLLLHPNDEVEVNFEAAPMDYDVTVPLDSLSISNCGYESSTTSNFGKEGGACNDPSRNSLVSSDLEFIDVVRGEHTTNSDHSLRLSSAVLSSAPIFKTVSDSVSSKLAAVHHVSQAIKSLRWMRHSHVESVSDDVEGISDVEPYPVDSSVCSCGDPFCIEVCYIWDWLPESKFDLKLWKLVLLLGESYLALGKAYMDDHQLHKALKVADLACSLYGSMPSHYGDAIFMSSLIGSAGSVDMKNKINKQISDGVDSIDLDQYQGSFLFWAETWTLIGDIYVKFHSSVENKSPLEPDENTSSVDLRLSVEIVKEVQRLNNKLNAYNDNCASCSLANCSCRSDRASSGTSASSSSAEPVSRSKKNVKQTHHRSINHPVLGYSDDEASPKLSEPRENHINEATSSVSSNIVEKSVISSSEECEKVENRGVFKYLRGLPDGDVNYYLSSALTCYKEAQKVSTEKYPSSFDLDFLLRKIGWVSNEMGRRYLQRKQLHLAEVAFADAISAFKEVSDIANIILIFCNLGHGRRALAEEMVMNMDKLKSNPTFDIPVSQYLDTAKQEYSRAIRYYGAAMFQVNAVKEGDDSVTSSLRNEVHTQYAHTYLILGMLLAREGTSAKVYESLSVEDFRVFHLTLANEGVGTIEITANDAIREALTVYESLGELRKQEAAYAYFQLACYQKSCCLKFLEGNILSRKQNINIHRVKQYVSLAERNWQKSIEFYRPKSHPTMYLSILLEKSSLLINLSSALQTNTMLESALSCMLEARDTAESSNSDVVKIQAKFWEQLQGLLKKMLCTFHSSDSKGSKSGDSKKLRELYKMALKSNDMVQLHAMHNLWTSVENINSV